MTFQISPLRRETFDKLFCLDDQALAARGARRFLADEKPGFPCRVSLEDAEPGERVLLVPFEHQNAGSPYRASGPVFVREAAQTVTIAPDAIPPLLRSRLLSVRAYDADHLMVEADVVEGTDVEPVLRRMLDQQRVSYLHIHFARPGCYACRVDRR